ncbi:MAG: hypothetical protein KatS3mg130_2196 [Candidatus Sumerlaea sp.]|nr:MAG: hypothetical protein KatS3mg130_2196 [Candidatus Sumerlaea sp.]
MPPQEPTLSSVSENTLKQRRWGCTCGCLASLAALVLGGLAFFYYALRPYPLSGAERWLQANTQALGVVRISSTDAGMSDLQQVWLKKVEEQVTRNLSEKDAKAAHSAFVLARQMTDWAFYPQIYFYEYGGGETRKNVTVVQLRHFFGWLLMRSLLQRYGFTPIQLAGDLTELRIPGLEETTGPLVGLSSNLLVIGTDEETVRAAVRAPARRPMTDSPGEKFLSYFEDLRLSNPEAGEDAAFLFVNVDGRVRNLVERIEHWTAVAGLTQRFEQMLAAQRLTFEDILALRLSMDVMSSDRIQLTWFAYLPTPDQARRLADVLRMVSEQLSASAQGSKLTVKAESRSAGPVCQFSMTISGLRTVLEQLFSQWLPKDSGSNEAKRPGHSAGQ